MTKIRKLWLSWGILYVVCALLSGVKNPQGATYGALFLLGMGFFVPPMWLVFLGKLEKNRNVLAWIRNLSIVSLSLTLFVILLNFLAVQSSALWGEVLYILLILVSCPMICTQVWVVSLFGWAFLLMASITYLREK